MHRRGPDAGRRPAPAVIRSGTPKLRAYTAAAAVGVVAALVFGRPELAAVVAPLLVLVAVGFAIAPHPRYSAAASLDRSTAIQGSPVVLRIDVRCLRPAGAVEVEALLPSGIGVEGPRTREIRLGGSEQGRVTMEIRPRRWGVFELGDVVLRAHDPMQLFRYEARHRSELSLKVYPDPEQLRTLARPAHTLRRVGSLVSREVGDGLELAEVRPFRSGDQVRSVNWRASARRTGLWVTDRHPERNADVVIFVDAFTNLTSGDASSLDASVRAAASLAEAHLALRDRVGLISFGGAIRWLMPGSDRRQYYRIVDTLLDTRVSVSFVWRGIGVIPPRVLPPRALVMAVSPLVDERTLGALFDLRGRGVDLVVLEIPADPFLPPARTDTERLARRIWSLKRDVLRHRLERLGVPVGTWRDEVPLEQIMGEVSAFRRHMVAPSA
jgi:uncharacterized protein (DUF58 family)